MPIDPSIADLSWLLQPGDAGSNLARGAAVGSQIAHQRMQNAALAERVMEFERTFPLQQALQKQEQEMNAAKLQGYLQDRQMEVDAGLAFAALRGKVDPLLRTGKIEDAQNLIIAEGADNALLLGDPRKRLQTLYDFTVKSQEAKTALINARNNQFTPQILNVTDPATGKTYPVVQTGPHVSQVLDPEKAAQNKRALDLREQHLQQDLSPVAKAELRDLYDQIKSKREKLEALPEMSGMVWNRQPNPKRATLEAEIDKLREKAAKLSAPSPASAATAQFQLGATYQHPNGKRYTYKGGEASDAASWQEVP